MQKFLILTGLILIITANVSSQNARPTPPAQDEDVVKISTALIQLDVTVTDKKGNAIRDLKQDDIEIYENGKKQKITGFSFVSGSVKTAPAPAAGTRRVPNSSLRIERPEQVRRTIALVVDDVTLSMQSSYRVRRALKKYVDEQMRDGDLVAIIRTAGGIGSLQQFTSDKAHLYAAIDKVRFSYQGNKKTGSFELINQLPESVLQQDAEDKKAQEDFDKSFNDFQASIFATGTLGALKYIVNGMGTLPGRKSVVLFSDGFPIMGADASRTLEAVKRVIEAANRASVVFYAVDSRGLEDTGITAADKVQPSANALGQVMSGRSSVLFETQQPLVMLSKETGGFPIINQNDLSGAVDKVLDDQSYYLISYEPDDETFDAKSRKFNRIEVRTSRDGATVRYRSGFFNIADESIAKAKPVQGQIPQLSKAINSPFGANEISLRLNAIHGNGPAGNYVTALLHIDAADLKFIDTPDGRKKAVIDLLAMTYGDNGVPNDLLAKSFTFDMTREAYDGVLRRGLVSNFTFPVKEAGPYQFRVAVRDAQNDTTGSASQFITVPNLKKGRLTLSGVLLENLNPEQLKRYSGNGSSPAGAAASTEPTDPFGDTSLRRFKRGTVLRFGYEIYNAKPDQTGKPPLKARINVFKDNELVMEGKLHPVDYEGQQDMRRIRAGGAIDLKSDMPAGDYILQIVVTDKEDTEKNGASQFVQFEVTE